MWNGVTWIQRSCHLLGGGVFFHLKPTLEEAHAIYVQVVLRSLLENDSSENGKLDVHFIY